VVDVGDDRDVADTGHGGLRRVLRGFSGSDQGNP